MKAQWSSFAKDTSSFLPFITVASFVILLVEYEESTSSEVPHWNEDNLSTFWVPFPRFRAKTHARKGVHVEYSGMSGHYRMK